LIRILTLIFAVAVFTAFISVNVYAGSNSRLHYNETDAEMDILVGVFDLRDRESYIQLTLTDLDENTENDDPAPPAEAARAHVQVFNLAQDCGENNFFDLYTLKDTHLYNMRNIVTNDGSDPGFTLPDNSYGFVVISFEPWGSSDGEIRQGLGNLRIVDASGFEYRTNLAGAGNNNEDRPHQDDGKWWFNFDTEEGVILSDIFATPLGELRDDNFEDGAILGPITNNYLAANIELLDLDEVVFSCGDTVFACTDGTDPLIPELLDIIAEENNEDLGTISNVSAEYGINETIPSSKGAPLLCANNTINAGTVFIGNQEHNMQGSGRDHIAFVIFVGLNNGNDRGTFDSLWHGEFENNPRGYD